MGTGDQANARSSYSGKGVFKSVDAGDNWSRLPPEMPEFCAGVNRPRMLTICVDPDDSQQVWFGVEEGGVWRSRDAGQTFTRVDDPRGAIRNSDIHAISILPRTAQSPEGQGTKRANNSRAPESRIPSPRQHPPGVVRVGIWLAVQHRIPESG